LGFVNALCVVATRIERGEIRAGLVVAGEDGRELVEATLASLARPEAGRRDLKSAFRVAGRSAPAAAAGCSRSPSFAPDAPRLLGAASRNAQRAPQSCAAGSAIRRVRAGR
jgi:3-oxoacyl-[acyl-carrier-protein] synthase-3